MEHFSLLHVGFGANKYYCGKIDPRKVQMVVQEGDLFLQALDLYCPAVMLPEVQRQQIVKSLKSMTKEKLL